MHLATPGTSEDVTFPFGPGRLFSTTESLGDSDHDGGEADLYLRTPTGRYVLVSRPTGVLDPGTPVTGVGYGQRSAPSERAVYFTSAGSYTTDDDDGGRVDLYERREGVTRLVSKADGVPDSATGDATLVAFTPGVESPHVFFKTTQQMTPDDTDGGAEDVYVRSDNDRTLLVSRTDGRDTPDSDPSPVTMSRAGLTNGGTRAFFTTTASLDPADVDGGRDDVYLRDIAESDTGLVSRPAAAGPDPGAYDASFDGVHGLGAIFSTRQPMTGDDLDGTGSDGFSRVAGQTRLVTTGPRDPQTGDAEVDDVSYAGVLFRTRARLTPADRDTSRVDVYLRRGRVTTLVSRATGGADPDSANAGASRLSEDGRIALFTTRERLVPQDRDGGQQDIYRYLEGRTTRVSSPTGVRDPAMPNDLTLSAASFAYDASRVFFVTGKRLTPDDNDAGRKDVYVNIGGTTTLVSKARGVRQPDTGGASIVASDTANPGRFYFATPERLAPGDTDGGAVDAYFSNLYPMFTYVRVSPREFHTNDGTTLELRVSESALVTIAFRRRGDARILGRIRVRAHFFPIELEFDGRLANGQKLGPGQYTATFVARDGLGARSRHVRRTFRILRPK